MLLALSIMLLIIILASTQTPMLARFDPANFAVHEIVLNTDFNNYALTQYTQTTYSFGVNDGFKSSGIPLIVINFQRLCHRGNITYEPIPLVSFAMINITVNQTQVSFKGTLYDHSMWSAFSSTISSSLPLQPFLFT